MFHAYALLIGATLPLVSASIYPTLPVQATVWTANQPMVVSWIEDGTYPTLGEMGPFDVTLWWNTNTFLAGLASNVDPMTKTCRVTVPAAVLRQGSKYTLRFTTTQPIHTVIYSADFMIVPANTTVAGTASNSGVASMTPSGTSAGSGFKTVPMATMTTTGGNGSAPSVSGTDTTPTPLASGQGQGQGQDQGQGQRATSAGRRSVDMEKLKFRFVFVIWPVLMGVAMAL